MSNLQFAHLMRGLLVAVALIFAVIQLALITAGPPDRSLEPILPLLSGAR